MVTRRPLKAGLLSSLDAADARLLGGRCVQCRLYHFPAGDICPYCSATGCAVEPLSAHGVLTLCTTVHNRPPGYDGALPFGFGVVELPEGMRLLTRVHGADASALPTAVQLGLESLGEDSAGNEVVTYRFSPDERAAPLPDRASAPPAKRPIAPTLARGLGGRPVYVAGVGLHPFGRFADKTIVELGIHAVRSALEDAELARGGFEAAYCSTVYGGVAAGHKVLTALGQTGVPIINVEAGCASGAAALRLAAAAVAAGQHDTVLVFGIEKMPRGIIRSSFFEPWREHGGLAVTPAYFALRAQRLMRDSGVTAEHLAQVSVKNHRNGVGNPHAMFRKELTRDEVLASAMVCDPLRLFMLCSPNEGAAALVVSAKPSRVRLLAAALRSHLPGNVLGEHTPLCGLLDDTMPSPSELAARDAFEAVGYGPADLDVVELQDTDAARELVSYEELGLCAHAAAAQWLEEGHPEMGGRLPVNPSGGLLSKGEPLGASALAQVIELYWQLRGEAGPRQVANAKLALAHTVGRGANAAVVVLERVRR